MRKRSRADCEMLCGSTPIFRPPFALLAGSLQHDTVLFCPMPTDHVITFYNIVSWCVKLIPQDARVCNAQ